MSLGTSHIFAVGELVLASTLNGSISQTLAWLADPGSSLTAAATLTPTNEFHKVTGSTTIDNVSPSSPVSGQKVRLLFQATVTVRHNGGGTGNVRLVGGLHAGFVANETLELQYDGTNWIEISRSPLQLSGESFIYGGSGTPTGAFAEDGSAISRTTYAAWFANVGTLYGTGDGSTTANLADSRGRADVGYAASGGHTDVSTIGNNDGVAAANRRPKHRTTNSLGISDPTHSHAIQRVDGTQLSANSGGGNADAITSDSQYNSSNSVHYQAVATSTGVTVNGSIGTNNANDVLDAPAYLVRPKFTRI